MPLSNAAYRVSPYTQHCHPATHRVTPYKWHWTNGFIQGGNAAYRVTPYTRHWTVALWLSNKPKNSQNGQDLDKICPNYYKEVIHAYLTQVISVLAVLRLVRKLC